MRLAFLGGMGGQSAYIHRLEYFSTTTRQNTRRDSWPVPKATEARGRPFQAVVEPQSLSQQGDFPAFRQRNSFGAAYTPS